MKNSIPLKTIKYVFSTLVFGLVFTGAFSQANTLPSSGNVGIGTDNPQSKLHIYQSVADKTGLIIQGNTINNDFLQHYVALTLDGDYGNATGNYSQIRSYSNLYSNWGSHLAFFTTSSNAANTIAERLRIDSEGNVGIGTSTPHEKLSVNGKIRANEIKVETANWPDYVFAKEYQLPSLAETEKHIKEKGHLQGIPSAKEAEANGINLGELNARLLQKIEELTLHLIAKEKALDIERTRNDDQEERLKKVELLIKK